MATTTQISSITKLAKQLAEKEMGSKEVDSQDMLNLLDSVATMLEANAGSHEDVKAVAKQVQDLVRAKSGA